MQVSTQTSSLSTRIALRDCPTTAKWVRSPLDPAVFCEWHSWLTWEERLRVSGYRRREDQHLFVARRGLARECIAREFSLEPQSIRLVSQPSGKLTWDTNDFYDVTTAIDLSVSRTSEAAAVVVCRTHDVGIDIERVADLPEIETLAFQNLHSVELDFWRSLPESSRLNSYYRLWVVKEAYVKALGIGLSLAPRNILAIEAISNVRGKVESNLTTESARAGEFWLKRIGTERIVSVVALKRVTLKRSDNATS